jgi:hypothetical protein
MLALKSNDFFSFKKGQRQIFVSLFILNPKTASDHKGPRISIEHLRAAFANFVSCLKYNSYLIWKRSLSLSLSLSLTAKVWGDVGDTAEENDIDAELFFANISFCHSVQKRGFTTRAEKKEF